MLPRKFCRFSVAFPISLDIDGLAQGEGHVYDLSFGGAAIESDFTVKKGEYLSLRLYLPDCLAPTVPLTIEVAAIRWAIQNKFGVEFIRMAPQDQERLRRFTSLQEASC